MVTAAAVVVVVVGSCMAVVVGLYCIWSCRHESRHIIMNMRYEMIVCGSWTVISIDWQLAHKHIHTIAIGMVGQKRETENGYHTKSKERHTAFYNHLSLS